MSDGSSGEEVRADDYDDESDEWTFQTEVPVRYADVDTYGHVNNAVLATYMEEARIDYFEAVLGAEATELLADEGDVGMVVANLTLEFQQPLGLTDAVTVAVTVSDLGRSSIPMEYEIRSEPGVVATGETTMVTYDRSHGESMPLPERWREAVESFEGI